MWLVDTSIKYLYIVVEDVLVKVEKLIYRWTLLYWIWKKTSIVPFFLVNFFLATARATLNMELGELMLRYENEHVYYNVFESIKSNNKET